MSETKVENVKDFLDKLTEIQKSKSDNTELFFRGHADQAYEAEPTIFRKNGNGERNLLKNEKHLFNDMITQCPEDFKDCQYTFEYLVKMQHYGLPTRLLDITSNALVALYFACCSLNSENNYKDGQVLVYAVRRDAIKNYNSDTVSVLSNLAQISNNFEVFTRYSRGVFEQLPFLIDELIRLRRNISSEIEFKKLVSIAQDSQLLDIKNEYKEGKQYEEIKVIELIEKVIQKVKLYNPDKIVVDIFTLMFSTQKKLAQLKHQQEHFISFIKQEKNYYINDFNYEFDVSRVVCVRAKLNNQRIIRQSGLFFLFGMGQQKRDPILLSSYIKSIFSGDTIKEIINPTIIISPEKKNDILKELRTLGISKETLMPEIDTVASTLKDRYN